MRFSAKYVFAAALVFFIAHPFFLAASPSASNAPAQLAVESMREPLGIGVTTPRLSWQLQDSRRGVSQKAYQILVASSPEALSKKQGDVWDSGRVESDSSVNVAYAGPALKSRQRYYWQVKVWNQQGEESAFSEASWWEMGMLSAEDWKAKWITRDLPLERGDYESGVQWIGGDEDVVPAGERSVKREFRLPVSLAGMPKDATLFITGQESVAAWINGKQVLGAPKDRHPWGYFLTVPVTQALNKGNNLLAVEVGIDKGDPGEKIRSKMLVLLRVQTADGKVQRFVSGPDWKTAPEQKSTDWVAQAFDDSSWAHASVIAPVGDVSVKYPWPAQPASLLRKGFNLGKSVRSARVYATALGSYQLYLNGQRVGKDMFAPGWTDYGKRIVYQVYDVTSQLHRGGNAIGAILGEGWYGSGLSWDQTRYNFGAPPVRVLVQLEVQYSDGSRETFASDESWKAAQSPILRSDIYNGENYDGRLDQSEWSQSRFPDRTWKAVAIAPTPSAPLVAQDFEPIRVERTLKAKTVTNPTPGVYIFDLGQNMVGSERLRVAGKAGTTVRIRFGEVLKPNGELYTENLRSAEAIDTYVLHGKGAEVFEPHFTFHGFRYIELTGYPGTPGSDAVEGVVFHTDAPFTMKFETADKTVNQLWSNILWGQRGNFLSVPTDCPQRDERLGWMGDAEIFWRTASYNANLAAFTRKFTTDIRDAQVASGAYTDVSPMVANVTNSVPGWADAGVIIPWRAYLQYSDTRVLEANWQAMERWMAHLEGSNPNHLWLKERGNDYGDWLAIGSTTSKDLMATAFWAYDASIMVKIAKALNRPADEKKYQEQFEKIRAAFNQAYVRPDGSVGTGSQTSYALALHMNLLSDANREIAMENIVKDIQAHDWHLTTGFLGTSFLMLELSKSGHSDVAYHLLFQRTYPSWAYMIDHGATTMWERWNGNQMMGDPSMNSFNHYAYGAVAEWLYRYAAGIDDDEKDPGFHHIVLQPQFDAQLGEVKSTYDSQYGPISSNWKVAGNTVTWNVVIPPNTTALIHLPAQENTKVLEGGKDVQQSEGISMVKRENKALTYEVASGSYEFTVQN